jgi:hypothetical protein
MSPATTIAITTGITTAVTAIRTTARAATTSQSLYSLAAAALLCSSACGGKASNDVRGRGLTVASLPAVQQAHIYEAAARGAFDVDNTSLLLDRRMLPREIGLAATGTLPGDVVAELRRRDAVKGTCQPPLRGTRGTARCSAAIPGYVLRFSPVFTLRGDSVQVYVYAQKYDTPSSGNSETLRFERAYQIVKRGDDWRAAREGRVPKEARGEGR